MLSADLKFRVQTSLPLPVYWFGLCWKGFTMLSADLKFRFQTSLPLPVYWFGLCWNVSTVPLKNDYIFYGYT